MDQLKVFMKQAVKYRFWIALGLSALLPLIGYFVGSGPIKQKADEETKKIEGSAKKVAQYTTPGLPNHQYPKIVKDKTEVVAQDVTKAWEKLYSVQAPLLKWPESVDDRFRAWGKKWPENVDRGAVQQAITDYMLVYDKAVDATFAIVQPWDSITGTGVVVVPEKSMLLGPVTFDPASPPELGKVWAAQEKLWIQGTLLTAIARINGKAKSWDSAIVKQILELDVGSSSALDQKSLVKGLEVEASPTLNPDGVEAPAAADDSSNPMAAMMSMGGGMGAGAAKSDEVYHVKIDSKQYSVMPIKVVAMIDQTRLEEYLIGLENSPMAIQVMEFELVKPIAPVTKPIKGDTPGGMYGGMYGGSGMSAMPGMMSGMAGMAGKSGGSDYPMGPSAGAGAGGYGSMGMMGMGMGGATTKPKSGVDARSKNPKQDREAKEKARRERARASDMYYDVVEVTIYGQARFYNPPPPAEAAEPSTSTAPEAATTADPGKPAPIADPGKPAPVTVPGKPAPVVDPGKPAPVVDSGKPAPVVDPGKPAPIADPGKPAAPAKPVKPADAPVAKPTAAPADAPKPADAKKPAGL